MDCNAIGVRHSVCVVMMFLGWGLLIAGVATPWWGRLYGPDYYFMYEGLWVQCLRQSKHDSKCHFSERNSGLWRGVQVMMVTSLVLVTFAVVILLMEAICFPFLCARTLRCAGRSCPFSAIFTLAASLSSLLGVLLYVGYMEFHSDTHPAKTTYDYSFALGVGGTIATLFNALLIYLTSLFYLPLTAYDKEQRIKEIMSAESDSEHWSESQFYRADRGPESSWRYYPSRHPDDAELTSDPPGPFFIGEIYRDPHVPYAVSRHPRRSALGDSSRGSPRPYLVDDRYRGWHSSSNHGSSSSGTRSSSRRGLYPSVSEQRTCVYPSLRESEARAEYDTRQLHDSEARAEYDTSRLHPLETRSHGLVSSAPEEIDMRSFRAVSQTEGELPGYFSQRRPHQRQERDHESTADSPTQDNAEYRTRVMLAREGGAKTRDQSRPESSTDLARQSSSPHTKPSRLSTVSISTQTASSLRHVQFEDEGHAETVSQVWGGPRRPAEEGLAHRFRPIHDPRYMDTDRRTHTFLHDNPGDNEGPSVEHLEQREPIGEVLDVGQLEEAGNVEGAVAFGIQRPVPRRPKPPSRRRPSLPLRGSRQWQFGRWLGSWARQPGQRRVVIKTRKDNAYDRLASADCSLEAETDRTG